MFYFGVPGTWYVQVFVPVSHCKDTHNFDKTNNFFKKVKKKESKCMLSSVRNLPSYSTTLLVYYCLISLFHASNSIFCISYADVSALKIMLPIKELLETITLEILVDAPCQLILIVPCLK